jgi:hypothetical protein
MTGAADNDPVLDFVDRYLAYLIDDENEPNINELDEMQRAAALQRLRVLDVLEPEPPPTPTPIEDDPIAKRFGFDRSAATMTISSAALKDAARGADIPFSELAKKLTAGGRPTQARDLLRLTNGVTADVDRDLATRFAAILKTSVDALEAAPAHTGAMTLDEYLILEEARDVIEQCARDLDIPFDDVQRHARKLVGAAAFRNRTNAAWHDALIAALARIRDERRR